MNNIISTTCLVLLVLTVPACATKINDEVATAKYLQESRNTAMEFRKKLMGVQKAPQLESVGARKCDFCMQGRSSRARLAEYSKDGQQLKRVSLKARNKVQGTPDAWEKKKY